MPPPYDICVVGAGLIGAAAAKYASEDRSLKVCLIGPEEPRVYDSDGDRDIFGAHYDEARITRCVDRVPVVALLAQRSIARYRDIEKKSGVSFYNEIGTLTAGTRGGYWTTKTIETANQQGIEFKWLQNNEKLREKFPYLTFSDKDGGVCEFKDAGLINPRRFISAQITLALSHGCDVIRDIVNSIEQIGGKGESIMKVVTDRGEVFHTKRVLLATGPYTNFRKLMDSKIVLDVDHEPFTVAKCEISEDDAHKIREMPAVMYRGFGGPHYWEHFYKNAEGALQYTLLPPVRYPDGKYYLKMSGPDASARAHCILNSTKMKQWYGNGGDKDLAYDLYELCKSVVTGVKILSWHSDACVLVRTPTYLPYIDMVSPNTAIIIGDNGYSAKSSDELGQMAARLVVKGSWDHDLPVEDFKLRVKRAQLSKI